MDRGRLDSAADPPDTIPMSDSDPTNRPSADLIADLDASEAELEAAIARLER